MLPNYNPHIKHKNFHTNFRSCPKHGRNFAFISDEGGIEKTDKKRYKVICKSILFVICIIGFLYQVITFLFLFWTYPTVLEVNMKYRNDNDMPAVTICNDHGLKIKNYCEQNRNNCRLEIRKKKKEEIEIWKVTDTSLEYKSSRNVFEAFGYRASPLIWSCLRWVKEDMRMCFSTNFTYIFTANEVMERRNCYNFYGRMEDFINIPFHAAKLFDAFEEGWKMEINMEPDEVSLYDNDPAARIAIHSSNTFVNPFFDGFRIQPDRLYVVRFQTIEYHLLPPPYTTQCKNYNEAAIHSRQMCLEECKMQKQLKECNCSSIYILYQHTNDICYNTHGTKDCTKKVDYSNCFQICQWDCDYKLFKYRVEEKELSRDFIFKAKEKRLQQYTKISKYNYPIAIVLIIPEQPEVLTYKYNEKFSDVEIFSYVGGYLGIWLGISLMTVVDFLELILSICNSVKKKFKRNSIDVKKF